MDMNTKIEPYNNIICPVCNQKMRSCVHCSKSKVNVCHECCGECEWLERYMGSRHCRYTGIKK